MIPIGHMMYALWLLKGYKRKQNNRKFAYCKKTKWQNKSGVDGVGINIPFPCN